MKFKINQIIDGTNCKFINERAIIIGFDSKKRVYKLESLDRYNPRRDFFYKYYLSETELKHAIVIGEV